MTHHKIVDIETGEETIIPFTDEEMAQYEIVLKEQEQIKAQKIAADEAKLAAESKLAALGLDADDLKALGLV
jgi:hypothetical protein